LIKQDWIELNYVSFWVVVVCAFGLGGVQLDIINQALRQTSQLTVIPIYLTCFTTVSILLGLVVFDEISSFTLLDWTVFPFSLVLTLLGVYVSFLYSHKPRTLPKHLIEQHQPVAA
jgi:hypothetical protein